MITSEREREDIFEQHMNELEGLEREHKRQKTEQQKQAFRNHLATRGDITLTTQWRKVKDLLAEEPTYKALSPLDQLEVFEGYIRDLENVEAEAVPSLSNGLGTPETRAGTAGI